MANRSFAASSAARDEGEFASAKPVVELKNVTKVFDTVVAVRDCSLTIHEGEFLSILGPSGCGKTTTLRLIAGLEIPTAGAIFIRGHDMTLVPTKDRNVGMVFQDYALFPHLSVYENTAFGLKVRKEDRAAIDRKVAEHLELVRLPGYEKRLPNQLSGGEQQRVALARALVNEPEVLLLDEPLSNLDRKLREEMELELKELVNRLNITTVFVTHDQDEALVMSDRIAVIDQGGIQQIDTPEALYERPKTAFVATFVGISNLFRGKLYRQADGSSVLMQQNLQLVLAAQNPPSGPALVAIRPEKVTLNPVSSEGVNVLPGVVRGVKYFGASTQYHVKLNTGDSVVVNVQSKEEAASRLPSGSRVTLRFPPEDLLLLEGPPEEADTFFPENS